MSIHTTIGPQLHTVFFTNYLNRKFCKVMYVFIMLSSQLVYIASGIDFLKVNRAFKLLVQPSINIMNGQTFCALKSFYVLYKNSVLNIY